MDKVGVLPFHKDAEGVLHYLVYRPIPKREADRHRMSLPFQLARGTVEESDASLEDAAYREMREEVGIGKADVEQVLDLGEHTYRSTRKEPYPIHWFAFGVPQPRQFYTAEDGAESRWMKGEQILTEAVISGEFKTSYVSLWEKLDEELRRKL